MGEESADGLVGLWVIDKVEARLFECAESEEQEGHAEEEVTDDASFLEIDEDDADEEGGIDEVGDVE